MYEFKITYRINGKIKTLNTLISKKKNCTTAESRREAMYNVFCQVTGFGNEEYYSWDDPELLEREIISIELVK